MGVIMEVIKFALLLKNCVIFLRAINAGFPRQNKISTYLRNFIENQEAERNWRALQTLDGQFSFRILLAKTVKQITTIGDKIAKIYIIQIVNACNMHLIFIFIDTVAIKA